MGGPGQHHRRPARLAASRRQRPRPSPSDCPVPQVLARLTDRRIAVEKELAALGEAKKGANEIFRHCRGFERAYSSLLQVRRPPDAGCCQLTARSAECTA